MTDREHLVVWLYDEPVAELQRSAKGTMRLSYTERALHTRMINQPVLSCSLPLRGGRLDPSAFVDGLLPEGDNRRYLAERAHLLSADSFGLVARYGRDIAGAVQFLPPDQHPIEDAHWSIEALDNDQLGRIVAELPTNPLAIVEESELSLAGLQDKTLLVALGDGQWGRPLNGQPSTHILKRDSDRHRGIVAAECGALALARHVGLTNVGARVEHHGDYDCLIIERFDRVVDHNGVVTARIHQEDACQALGLPPTRKYEIHHGGGGPEFAQIADLLDRYSADPTRQLDRLAAVAAFTAIIGNADAHGKNVAFLISPDGAIELSPIYDTVPTALWPTLRSEAAMSLGGAVTFDAMDLAAIAREAKLWRHSPRSATTAARTCAEMMLDALDRGVIDSGGDLAQRVGRTAPRFIEAA